MPNASPLQTTAPHQHLNHPMPKTELGELGEAPAGATGRKRMTVANAHPTPCPLSKDEADEPHDTWQPVRHNHPVLKGPR